MSASTVIFLLFFVLDYPVAAWTDASDPENPSSHTQAAPIQDNSFLIEEAYNQEDGVVQHISYMQRSFVTRDWVFTQTDEWPLRTVKHQLSLTMSALHSGGRPGFGLGDTAVHYRYQLAGNGNTKMALAPRLSLLLPSGNFRLGRGNGGWGLQTNLPASLQHNSWLITHWNAGMTWIPHAHNSLGAQNRSLSFNLGQSFIWLASPRFNGLFETLWTSTEDVVGPTKSVRRQDIYVSPGIRWAHNFANGLQIVPGVGVPTGVGPSAGKKGLIFYLSFEHPWGLAHSR